MVEIKGLHNGTQLGSLIYWVERRGPVIGGNGEMDGVLGIILKWKKQTIHHGFCIN